LKCLLLLSYLVVISSGCAVSQPTFEPYDFHKELQKKTVEQKLDQLVIILDASISMTEPYMGQEKFKTAILILHYINAALSSIRVPIGFYVLGTGACHFCEKSLPLFHISPYQQSRLQINQLKKINPGGETPLQNALVAVKNEFQFCNGKMGLIVISDFEMDDLSIKKALHPLINLYNNRLSLCFLSVGTSGRTIELSRSLSSLHNNIQCLHSDQILSYNVLKQFTQQFFLKPIYDHDLDGVPDKRDHCKNTPSGAWIDDRGCPKDSDNDGVFDGLDQCNDTYKGASVNKDGCWILPVLFYAQNQFYMTGEQEKKLSSFVKIIKENHICIEIQGHADSSGSKQNNYDVSFKRAQSVKAYLLSLGLRHYQMQIKAFGASTPIDHRHALLKNATQRRVTFEVIDCQNQ
jgi:OOP family OmpA-OmpF porin